MSGRIGMNQVKIRVRATILALNQFTVDDLVRTTGLNPSSIHSELHRLKREGLVRAVDEAAEGKPRVGVPKRYEVVAEPDNLRRLSESIESFRVRTDPAPLQRPASNEFQTLQKTLDLALIATPEQRTELLRDGERLYQAAVEAEIATVAPESVQSYLRFERARLSYLTGDYDRAERIFCSLQPVLTRLGDTQTAALVDDYCLTLTYQRKAQQAVSRSTVSAAEDLIDDVQQSSGLSGNPLAVVLTEALQKTVTRLRELERVAVSAEMQTREHPLHRLGALAQLMGRPYVEPESPSVWSFAHCKVGIQDDFYFHLPSLEGTLAMTALGSIGESVVSHGSSAVEALNAAIASIRDDDRGLSVIHFIEGFGHGDTGHGFTPDITHPQPPGAGILMVDDNGNAERAMVVISPEHLNQAAVGIGHVNWDVPIEDAIRQAALSQFGDAIRASGLPEVSLNDDASVKVVVSAPFAERWQP